MVMFKRNGSVPFLVTCFTYALVSDALIQPQRSRDVSVDRSPGRRHGIRTPFVSLGHLLMARGNCASSRVQRLRAHANSVALKYERATREAERLESTTHAMISKRKHEMVPTAYTPTHSLGIEEKRRKIATERWPGGVAKHRFVGGSDDSTCRIPGSRYEVRSMFVGSKDEGAYEGSFQLCFKLPGRKTDTVFLELLPTSSSDVVVGTVKLPLLKALELIYTCNVRGKSAVLNTTEAKQVFYLEGMPFEDSPLVNIALDLRYWNDPNKEDSVRIAKQVLKEDSEDHFMSYGGLEDGDILRAIGALPLLPGISEGEDILFPDVSDLKVLKRWSNFGPLLPHRWTDVVFVIERARSLSASSN